MFTAPLEGKNERTKGRVSTSTSFTSPPGPANKSIVDILPSCALGLGIKFVNWWGFFLRIQVEIYLLNIIIKPFRRILRTGFEIKICLKYAKSLFKAVNMHKNAMEHV